MSDAVAIIGLACRMPGAADAQAFWRNLVGGVESIRRYSPDELRAWGIDAAEIAEPWFVPAAALIDDHDRFDAAFFGFTPREAQVLDPQHRVFFECAWAALEDAGCVPSRTPGAISVFAGTSLNTYLLSNLMANADVLDAVGIMQAVIASDKDFLATHVSYKLDLRGPSLTVQTACSTSLVAVQLAYQHLMTWQCDVALAGGVSVQVPHRPGYRFEDGAILSPDGRCRPFDAAARGTVKGNGVGVVVLKRLDEAIADGDRIVAVIRGAAINNDGARKIGFTAPGVDGQAEVIATALAQAGVGAETIGFVEAHGTATPLGDPVEVSALTRVFRAATPRQGFCALGSVKSNIGHLDAAAGVAGLIKAALAVEHAVIPPTVLFQEPNPRLELPVSPFYVNAEARPWPATATPRRAGVSSFGLGGTNAHVVLEQAPDRPATSAPRATEVIVLSARTERALEAGQQRLATHLREHPALNLGDVAWTLQTGRTAFPVRAAIAATSIDEAVAALTAGDVDRGEVTADGSRRAVFLFPGHGTQYQGMGAGLFAAEPVFAEAFADVASRFQPIVGERLKDALLAAAVDSESPVTTARLGLPILFAFEYALARWWMRMGVEPAAMIGHSLGEYAAACLAGVMTLDEAVALVAARARLMDALPPGAMLAVRLHEDEVVPYLEADVSLAAVNAPRACILSGTLEAIARVEDDLTGRGIQATRVRSSLAAHSRLLDPILDAFRAEIRRVRLAPPAIPYVSNLTGTWIQPGQACDPEYWVRHLRETVRFADGLRILLEDPRHVPLEVGPRQSLTRLAQSGREAPSAPAIASGHDPQEQGTDERVLMTAVARIWTAGVDVDWTALRGDRRRRRVALPTYAFERTRHWLDAPPRAARTAAGNDVESWLYVPYWRPAPLASAEATSTRPGSTLVFGDGDALEAHVAGVLTARGDDVILVRRAIEGASAPDGVMTVGGRPEDYARLIADLEHSGRRPTAVMHLWSVAEPGEDPDEQDRGFASLLWLAQAVAGGPERPPLHIVVVGDGVLQVHPRDVLQRPWRATVLGPCHVVPQEDGRVTCRYVDLEPGPPVRETVLQLIDELDAAEGPVVVAYRGGRRWERTFERRAPGAMTSSRFVKGGVYWITGGTGGIGLAVARWLAREYGARLVLTQRTPLPPREAWESCLEAGPDEPVATRIRALLDVERIGGEVLVAQADVTQRDQAEAVEARIRERYGRLDGVVHSAGVPGGGLVALKTLAAADVVMSPKIRGAVHVAAVAHDLKAGFLALCSSIAGLQGGFGQVDYAGANAALDAFAAWHQETTGMPTFAVDWDAWKEAGMGVETHARITARIGHVLNTGGEAGPGLRPGDADWMGMRSADGCEALRLVVDGRHPHVAVSMIDLVTRIRDQRLTLARITDTASADGSQAPGAAIAESGSGLEARVAGIWQRVLGVDPVGWHDNFFELGGDSLAGVQVVAQINRELGRQITVAQFFEAPTVASLAALMRGPVTGDDRPLDLSRGRGRARRERHDQRRARSASAADRAR